MTTETTTPVEDRLLQLLQHLGIKRAHFATRALDDLAVLTTNQPEIFLSLTMVCPWTPGRESISSLASRLLVFRGDVPGFDHLGQLVTSLPGATLKVLHDYVAWSDFVAVHKEAIQSTMLPFLATNTPAGMSQMTSSEGERGEIAGITYHIQGSGPPLVLLPLGLVSSQWDPIMPALTREFCTITLGGAELGIAALLEKRAISAGYLGMVRTLVQEADPRPGEAILEVGCGTGALSRWLAGYTAGKNPITGVDFNRYLLREAANLSRSKGVEGLVQFEEGNAEELAYPDDSFDLTMSVTMIEEVHADKALAEMVRVTRPGGRVAVITRAMDVPFFLNMPLREALKARLEDPTEWVNAGPHGCADASLYRRFQAANLSGIKMFPYLAALNEPWVLDFVEGSAMSIFNEAETAEWQTAREQTESEGTFIFSYPHHCAVGTVL